MVAAGTEPEAIGERVVRSVKRGDLYILRHADVKRGIEAKMNEILTAFELE